MNYVAAVYGVMVFLLLLDWFIRARRSFQGSHSCGQESIQKNVQESEDENVQESAEESN